MAKPLPTPAERLRALLARGALAVPGVADPLTALAAQDAGFDALFLSGAGLSFASRGLPDLAFHGLAELADATARIAGRVPLPLIVDADTGFGNALNAADTARTLERAGAAAIILEDQAAPKRCGHLAGKRVIAAAEAAGKIAAASAARCDLLIVARTDALAVEGIDAAVGRARAYAEAGADLLFVEAPCDPGPLAIIARELSGLRPLVVNMVEAAPPGLGVRDVAALGFAVALFPVAALRAQLAASRAVFAHLRAAGTLAGAEAMLSTFDDLNSLTGLPALLAAGRAFDGGR